MRYLAMVLGTPSNRREGDREMITIMGPSHTAICARAADVRLGPTKPVVVVVKKRAIPKALAPMRKTA